MLVSGQSRVRVVTTMGKTELNASRRQEARLAKRFGGQTTPGSGNQWYRKNDIRSVDLSIEAKYTGKRQYTLKADEIEKAERNALLDDRGFAFCIELNKRNWVIISEDDFVSL